VRRISRPGLLPRDPRGLLGVAAPCRSCSIPPEASLDPEAVDLVAGRTRVCCRWGVGCGGCRLRTCILRLHGCSARPSISSFWWAAAMLPLSGLQLGIQST
jgi:hypothetical protein